MRISPQLNHAMNAQIGHELYSSNQYLGMAAYFDDCALKQLGGLFYKQAEEEREHALKFVHYLPAVNGKVEIPQIDAPRSAFLSVEEALQLAYHAELKISDDIDHLMSLAIEQKDYASQEFLRWFVTEQVEEVSKMENLLRVVQRAGERSMIMIEAYLVHGG